MPGQFDKESSVQNFEWHRERVLREKKKGTVDSVGANRIDFNLRAVAKKHGEKAARELARELRSR
jgi:hypothetical protein